MQPGKKGLEAAARDARYGYFKTLNGKIARASAEVKPGDHILFKASRAMALETVSAAVSEAVAARLAHTDQSES